VIVGVSAFVVLPDEEAAGAGVLLLLWPPSFARRFARILSASESMAVTDVGAT
jgi:hypothetical protein